MGLRDRAVLGVLAYTGARIGAVGKLRLSGYRNTGEQWTSRFRKKGGQDGDSGAPRSGGLDQRIH